MTAVAYRLPTVYAQGAVARAEYRVNGLLVMWRRTLDDEGFEQVVERTFLCLDWLGSEQADSHGRLSDVACALLYRHRALPPARWQELDHRVRDCVTWLRETEPRALDVFRKGE